MSVEEIVVKKYQQEGMVSMKRNLLVLLLAVVMAVPALAVEMEIIPKVGYLFTPKLTATGGNGSNLYKESSFSFGADYFFKIGRTNLFIGPGLMWNSKHKVQLNDGPKFGFTNIYATAKYKFNAGKVNIYPFLQLGLGVSNVDDFELISREEGISEKDKFEFNSGAYYGIGVGAEYKNIVLELLYGWNIGDLIHKNDVSREGYHRYVKETKTYTYSAFRVQVGYKFSL